MIYTTSDKRLVANRPVLVSHAEIANRRQADALTAASFAVDNIPANPDTQYLFRDYVEGRIATNQELTKLLHEHYSKMLFGQVFLIVHNFPYNYTLDDYDWENQIDQHDQENGALKNYYNLSDKKKIDAIERDFSYAAQLNIINDGINPVFSSEYYRSIHHKLFSNIYPWAGEFRTVDFTKGDSIFVPVQNIETLLNKSLIQLYCNLKTHDASDKDSVANDIGRFVADVNTIHPFREGNGRTQRIFSGKVANKHGYQLNYASVSNERMKQAAIAAFESDYEPMQKIMRNIIGPKLDNSLPLQSEHLIDDDDFNYIKYKSKNAGEDQKIESGVVKHVSENYILMKNDDGFSVYKRLDFNRNYAVGQVIGEDGELVGKPIDNVSTETNLSTDIISRSSNKKKPQH